MKLNFLPLLSMKRVNILILFLFLTVIAKSQEDSTQIDSLIALELQEEFAAKTSVTIPAEITDEHLITFYNDQGVKYDSACTNLELYREIYGWLGVKYKYAGLSKNGVDCAGFVTNICNKTYATKLSGSATHHFEKCIEINDPAYLEEGDLVFFKINKPNISHVGLYLGNGKFAHAAVHGGVMINDLSEKYYSKYYFTGGRLKSYEVEVLSPSK
jgi:lipoprotein Spr